jgi:hypothetical protein
MRKMFYYVLLGLCVAGQSATQKDIITVECGTHCIAKQEGGPYAPMEGVLVRTAGENDLFLLSDGSPISEYLFALLLQYVDNPNNYGDGAGELTMFLSANQTDNQFLRLFCSEGGEALKIKTIRGIFLKL